MQGRTDWVTVAFALYSFSSPSFSWFRSLPSFASLGRRVLDDASSAVSYLSVFFYWPRSLMKRKSSARTVTCIAAIVLRLFVYCFCFCFPFLSVSSGCFLGFFFLSVASFSYCLFLISVVYLFALFAFLLFFCACLDCLI